MNMSVCSVPIHRLFRRLKIATLGAALALSCPVSATEKKPAIPEGAALKTTMKALDAEVFGAFNRCSDAKELERHARYFSEDVEFYHDNGGVTWTRDAMIENTRKHACGHYIRALLEETFEVSPIAGFGALTRGVHRFCTTDGLCEGKADFLMLWRYRDGQWVITRAFSFGHRASM